jgi:hypothetical protein
MWVLFHPTKYKACLTWYNKKLQEISYSLFNSPKFNLKFYTLMKMRAKLNLNSWKIIYIFFFFCRNKNVNALILRRTRSHILNKKTKCVMEGAFSVWELWPLFSESKSVSFMSLEGVNVESWWRRKRVPSCIDYCAPASSYWERIKLHISLFFSSFFLFLFYFFKIIIIIIILYF